MIEAFWHPDHHEMEAWKAAPLADLVAYIVEHYHLEARLDMARMENLAEAGVLLLGGAHPGLVAIRGEVGRFCQELRAHMAMEERSLFRRAMDGDA